VLEKSLLDVLNATKINAEQLLSVEDFEPQQLSDIMENLTPIITQLAGLARSDEGARQTLSELKNWLKHIQQRVLEQKSSVAANIKELNTGRKASHNYRINR